MSARDTATPDEAQRLLSESETCSLLPWEIEDDGDDYVISSPGAHAEIARVHHGQGADIDAAWIVRAVNTLPRLARAVVAQGEDNARLKECVAETRAQLLAVGAAYEHATAERDRLTGEVLRITTATTTPRGPLSWESVQWDAADPDVMSIHLREPDGAARVARIPAAKAAAVGAAAKAAKGGGRE